MGYLKPSWQCLRVILALPTVNPRSAFGTRVGDLDRGQLDINQSRVLYHLFVLKKQFLLTNNLSDSWILEQR